jgi:hypothetical protein
MITSDEAERIATDRPGHLRGSTLAAAASR